MAHIFHRYSLLLAFTTFTLSANGLTPEQRSYLNQSVIWAGNVAMASAPETDKNAIQQIIAARSPAQALMRALDFAVKQTIVNQMFWDDVILLPDLRSENLQGMKYY